MNNTAKITTLAKNTHFNCANQIRCCSSSAMNHIGTEASAIGISNKFNQSQTVSLALNPVQVQLKAYVPISNTTNITIIATSTLFHVHHFNSRVTNGSTSRVDFETL